MLRFVAGRLVESIVVLLAMSFIIYWLMGLMPGDPIDIMIASDPNLTAADAVRLKALFGLDQPILDRYLAWGRNALAGDFGYSRLHIRPVLEVLGARLPNTILLLGLSLVLSLAIAIPAGIYAALKPYSRIDYAINLTCFAGISVPPFWLALLLIILFAVTLGWLPAGGMGHDSFEGLSWFGARLQHLILPTMTLTLLSVGGFTRFMRASMLQTLRHPHRTRQRRQRGPHGNHPRVAQRPVATGDDHCPQLRCHVLRRAHHGDDVLVAGHGQDDLRLDSRK